MRSRNAASFSYGARVTATRVVLRTCSCLGLPIPSAAEEQLGQPASRGCSVPSASVSLMHMKWCITSCWRPSNRSSKPTVPSGPSNTYGLSTRTIGSRRRSAVDPVSGPGRFLLLHQQLLAGGEPLLGRHHLGQVHACGHLGSSQSDVVAPGGPASTLGTYSSSCSRPSKVRLLTISRATSG